MGTIVDTSKLYRMMLAAVKFTTLTGALLLLLLTVTTEAGIYRRSVDESSSAAAVLLVNDISKLNVIEVADLDQLLEKISGTPVQTLGDSQSSEDLATDAGNDVSFSVTLTGYDSKVSVIKKVRSLTGWGLTQAKEFVESAPQFLKGGLSEEQAMQLKEDIESSGGSAEIHQE